MKYSELLIFLFLILLPGFYCQLHAQNDDLYFESLAPEPGLSQITVGCIFQDSKGISWFGTQGGLNRFDGYHFEVFKNSTNDSNSISNNDMNGITGDSKGHMWVAAHTGLNCYENRTNGFRSFLKSSDNKGISHNKASCIYRDKNRKT